MYKNIASVVLPMERRREVSVLAVGEPDEWERQGCLTSSLGNMVFVAFHEVPGGLLDELQPSTVVSPALAKGFDCIDLAILLNRLNFNGNYRAMADNLPKPSLIEAEIAQLCPRLHFEIIAPDYLVAGAMRWTKAVANSFGGSHPTDTRKKPSEIPSSPRCTSVSAL